MGYVKQVTALFRETIKQNSKDNPTLYQLIYLLKIIQNTADASLEAAQAYISLTDTRFSVALEIQALVIVRLFSYLSLLLEMDRSL